MKLSEAQRQELFDAMMGPPRVRIKELEEIVTVDIDRIQPIVEKWFDKYESALAVAESFMTGFEDDETQVGLVKMLTEIRALLPNHHGAPIQQDIGWVSPHRYTVRVRYKIMGGNTHFQIRTGKTGFTLGVAVESGCMTNEEFEAFMHSQAFMEFINDAG